MNAVLSRITATHGRATFVNWIGPVPKRCSTIPERVSRNFFCPSHGFERGAVALPNVRPAPTDEEGQALQQMPQSE
ncbi:MAG: hypothetical protein WAU39_06500 [Polyangiales bacterium]